MGATILRAKCCCAPACNEALQECVVIYDGDAWATPPACSGSDGNYTITGSCSFPSNGTCGGSTGVSAAAATISVKSCGPVDATYSLTGTLGKGDTAYVTATLDGGTAGLSISAGGTGEPCDTSGESDNGSDSYSTGLLQTWIFQFQANRFPGPDSPTETVEFSITVTRA